MHLVTNRRINAVIDPETKETKTTVISESHVETDDVQAMLQLRSADDDRLKNMRVFPLEIDKFGKPTIGEEL